MVEASIIHPKFKPLYESTKRYFALTGGRGGGKTYAVHEFIARLTYEKGHGILFTRYTMVSAEKSIIPEFKGTLTRLGIIDHFHITKTHIYNRLTKSFIFFSGIKTSSGDQTANLKSLPGITTWVIEEGEDYKDEKSFTDIDDSIRKKGIQNRVIWIQNPAYADESFFYDKFYKGYEEINTVTFNGIEFKYTTTTHPNVENIHITYLDNRENINPDKVAMWDKVSDDDPEFFEYKYIGAWLTSKEGAVFTKTDLDRFSLKDFNYDNIETTIGFGDPADRGTDSTSFPIGCVVGHKIYITDWYFSQANKEVTIPELAAMTFKNKVEHLGVETNGLGLTYYEELEQNVGAMTYPISQQTNKHSRIIFNSGFVRNYFVFRDDYEPGSMYDKAMRELFSYNKDDKENRKQTKFNDDAPDSITGLWLLANDLIEGRWV